MLCQIKKRQEIEKNKISNLLEVIAIIVFHIYLKRKEQSPKD